MVSLDIDPVSSDPEILSTNSTFRTYFIAPYNYLSLRIFYHPHSTSTSTTPAPLLILIHGLGGSTAQFSPLVPHLTPHYTLLAVDLPGCGRSAYHEIAYPAYSHPAMAHLLSIIICDYYDRNPLQKLILLGHSMGTALAARLANPSLTPPVATRLAAIVALCPPRGPPPPTITTQLRRLLWFPEWLINLLRMYDRWGGLESRSVLRYAGPDAPVELRKQQLRYNSQNKTGPWKRMSAGLLAEAFTEDGTAVGGMSGVETWREVKVPVLLVGGEADHVTKLDAVEAVAKAVIEGQGLEDKVQTKVLPAPANHTLLYDARFVPEVAQLINDFLTHHGIRSL